MSARVCARRGQRCSTDGTVSNDLKDIKAFALPAVTSSPRSGAADGKYGRSQLRPTQRHWPAPTAIFVDATGHYDLEFDFEQARCSPRHEYTSRPSA